MPLFQVPLSLDQITKLSQNLPSIPSEYLSSMLLAFSFVFLLLSVIKLNIKMRIIAGIVVAVALASVNLLPSTISSQISNYISPFTTTLTSFTKSLGLQGTLIASGVLIFVGVILGKISGKSLFKKTVKKAGEPTSKNEKVLEQLEKKRDHMIAQLKNAKGDPVSELQIEKAINQINEKINILKAKLGLPITA